MPYPHPFSILSSPPGLLYPMNFSSLTSTRPWHTLLLLLPYFLLGLIFTACTDDNAPQTPIHVGATNADTLTISPQATRIILLSGGTGKYAAYVADGTLASAAINEDTLRITGHLVGETYATIHSGDEVRRVALRVEDRDVSVSHHEVRLFPRDESRYVSVNGGGDYADLEVNDPEGAIAAKWNAKNNVLEIDARHEGVAQVKILPPTGSPTTVKVVVKCEGEVRRPGIYGTTSRSLFYQMNTLSVVHRKGVGVWLNNNTRPYNALRSLQLTPAVVNPQVGQHITLNYAMRFSDEFRNSGITEGSHSLIVEEVRTRYVVLRGRGHKLVLPYETK